ncbi:MAG: hypothetical protein V7641_3350 [Blastocatellia bacterium]
MGRRIFLIHLVLLYAHLAAPAQPQSNNSPSSAKPSSDNVIKLLIEQRRYDEAIPLLEDALRREPSVADRYEQLGNAYFAKSVATKSAALEAKAFASLRRAIELSPQRADLHSALGRVAFLAGRYEEAAAACDRAIQLDAGLLQAYPVKWESLMKRPDFEAQAVTIRSEIEKLQAKNQSERALGIAASGFELLADEQAVQKIHDRVLADFPKSEWAQDIVGRRALAEPDRQKRTELLEAFIAHYPEDGRAWLIYADLFRTRANQPDTPSPRLNAIGDAWIRHVPPTAYSMIAARVKVALVLAERQSDLDHAGAIADEAANMARNLAVDSPLVATEPPAGREPLIARLREETQMAVGFVHLRQRRITEAAKELSGPLQPVSKQVERDGYILWKDADLREFGLRPRVLWLAELFEAQGDYQQAARYLLAGASDDERGNQTIQSRLTLVYAKLGRSQQEAAANFNQALQRYHALTTPTLAMRDEEKRRLLASRTAMPVPDFKALRLDKQEIRFADFKGKVAVLIFWATWCGPCVAEMPHFQEAVRKYAANQAVIFLAISIDERKLAVRPFIERNRYHLPVAYDINGEAALGINAVPSLIIIDRQGRVAFRESGFGSEADHYVERLSWRIDELLKEDNQ